MDTAQTPDRAEVFGLAGVRLDPVRLEKRHRFFAPTRPARQMCDPEVNVTSHGHELN